MNKVDWESRTYTATLHVMDSVIGVAKEIRVTNWLLVIVILAQCATAYILAVRS